MPGRRLGEDGWLAGVRRLPSAHQSPRPPRADVCLAVIHGISLPPGEFGGDAVPQLFCGALDCDAHPYYQRLRGLRVSAHFFIRRGGALLQFVPVTAAAWHAGDSMWRGRSACNDFSVGIELEGADDTRYTGRQYRRLAALIQTLGERLPQLAVAGHCHIAPGRKTDPGGLFAWDKLFNLIGDHYDGRPA